MLVKLLLSFMQIGLVSIGGGYAALPMIQEQVVNLHHWLSMREFGDVLTISQMTPGPIAINAATFVGMKLEGLKGAICASVGVVLPSFIIVLLLSYIYYKYRDLSWLQAVLKGLRPAVVALIAAAGLSIIISCFWTEEVISVQNVNVESVCLFVVAFFILRKYQKSPIFVMLICGVSAVLLSLLET